jgi:uncharacterized protein (DUF433 family)
MTPPVEVPLAEREAAASQERARGVLDLLRSDATLLSLRSRVRESAAALVGQLVPQPPPLYPAEEGAVIRVSNTRVSLDSVIWAFQQGCSPEGIVSKFPSLSLPDVYAVIAHYLRHRAEVDDYLGRRREEADAIERMIRERFPSDGIRERLMARRAAKSEP